MVVFQFFPRKFVIQTWFCNCQLYHCLFHIVFEYTPSIRDQEKMLVLPNQVLYGILSTSDQCFVSFQPIWCHPHTQIRITLFHDEQRDIPNLEFSPSHVSIGFSQIAFPIMVLPKGDRTDSFREERLGLPYWNHDFGHLCRGGRIQMSGHSDFGFFNYLWAFSIFTWVYADTASAACPAHPGSLDMISMTFAAVICDADDPCSVNAAQDPESSFTMSPRCTTRLLYYWCFASNSAFSKWLMSINDAKWTVAPDILASSITSFLLLTFVNFHAEIFSNVSHSLSTAAFAGGICMAWGIGINLWTKL